MIKKPIFFSILALILVFAFACSNRQVNLDRPEKGDLSERVAAWLEDSLDMFIGQQYRHDGKLYILVTYGEKPSGGYAVEITDLQYEQDRLVVTVNFIEPKKGDMVTDDLTYPYDLIVIDDPDLPVKFDAVGAEEYIPTLYGLNQLLPVAAGSQFIKIFAPQPGETVPEFFTVHGIANVFEGTVQYQLTTGGGEEIAEGFATGMMGDWGYFSFTVNLVGEVKSGTQLLLEIYSPSIISPKDENRYNLVTLELFVE